MRHAPVMKLCTNSLNDIKIFSGVQRLPTDVMKSRA
jgi:hypothetical protein